MQLYGISPVHPHCFSPGGEDNFPAVVQIIVGAEFAPPMIDKLISLGCVVNGDHKDLERHIETMPDMFGGGRFWGADVTFPTWQDYHTWWHWMREKMCTDSAFPVVNMNRQYRSAVPVYYETAVAAVVYPSVKKAVTPLVRDTKEQNDAFHEFMKGVVAKDRFPYNESEHLQKVAKSIADEIADEMKKPGYARQILGHIEFPEQPLTALAQYIEQNVRDDGSIVGEDEGMDIDAIYARTAKLTRPEPILKDVKDNCARYNDDGSPEFVEAALEAVHRDLAVDEDGNVIRITARELIENFYKHMDKQGKVPSFQAPEVYVTGREHRYLTPEDKAISLKSRQFQGIPRGDLDDDVGMSSRGQ